MDPIKDLEQWITYDAKEAIHLNLTRPSPTPEKASRILNSSFHPRGFTSEFFGDNTIGDDELLIGYKEPLIELDFRGNDLRPTLKVSYKAKWPAAFDEYMANEEGSSYRRLDIDTVFEPLLPKSSSDPSAPSAGPDATSADWKPPGKCMESFTLHSKQYELWSVSLADAYGLELWQNMQLLVLFLIDGASPIDLGEDWTHERWTLHLLYDVTPSEDKTISPYTLAGCCTSYRYWVFPTQEVLRATACLPTPPPESNGDASPTSTSTYPRHELAEPSADGTHRIFKDTLDPLSTPSRERISQFLILPPYEGRGLGTQFYNSLFTFYRSLPNIFEIPVEDSNQVFEDMRDYADVFYFRSLPELASLTLPSEVPADMLRKGAPVPRDYILGGWKGLDLTSLRHKTKIPPRQFNRVIEMHTLLQIPPMHRKRARLTRKEKSSSAWDRKYYFWRLAVKARIWNQNRDTMEQMDDDPEERVIALEKAVDGQLEEFEEREIGIHRRERRMRGEEVSDHEDADEDDGEVEEVAPRKGLKRNRAVVVEEDEDGEDGWEDVDEESGREKKARKA